MIQWILGNWAEIVTGILAVLGGFSILAKLTPSTKDDMIIAKIINFVGLAKKK